MILMVVLDTASFESNILSLREFQQKYKDIICDSIELYNVHNQQSFVSALKCPPLMFHLIKMRKIVS